MVIYADYNATTPCLPEVAAAVAAALTVPGNPSARQHALGRTAAAQLEDARLAVQTLIGQPRGTVVFTSGATEACNLAIRGVAERLLGVRPRFVLSAIEHPAVAECHRRLREAGADVVTVGVDRHGVVDLGALERAVDARTALVSVMAANHETGVLQPVAAAAALAHAHGALLLCDATQALGRTAEPDAWSGADLIAGSAHKLYGPLGAGCLWLRLGLALEPQLAGGGQERGLRSGTHNLPALIGFGIAAAAAHAEAPRRLAHLAQLTAACEQQLRAQLPGVVIQGAGAARVPGTSYVTLPGLPRGWLTQLGGVAVSAGSSCHAGSTAPSAVLTAMGVPAADAANSIRISFGLPSTLAEVEAIVHALVRGAQVLGQGAPAVS